MWTEAVSDRKPAEERSPAATRERVLDVAERLFAERGSDAVSIRDITGEAGANLGAINYHFGTKEKLVEAVIERRIVPLSQERLRALDNVEKVAANKPPKLEAVLEAMFRPAIEQAMDPSRGGAMVRVIMARWFVEANPVLERLIRSHFEPVIKRFDTVLLRVMPGLTREDLFWRMHLLMGALHQSLLIMDRKPPMGEPLRLDVESYIEKFLAFAAAGFRAQAPPEARRRSRSRELASRS